MTAYRNIPGARGLSTAVVAAVVLVGVSACASNGDVRATFTPAASPGGSPQDPNAPADDDVEPDEPNGDLDGDSAADGAPGDEAGEVIGADGETPVPLDKPDPRAGGEFSDPPTGEPAPRPAPRAYATDTRSGGEADAASLVGVEAQRRDGWEEITFTFVDADAPPAYEISYVDAVRPHDEADPIPLNGAAFLQVDFSGVDPTTGGVMAVPSDVRVGQPRIREVVLAENVGGELRFGVSLSDRGEFQVRELDNPTRLVIQVS